MTHTDKVNPKQSPCIYVFDEEYQYTGESFTKGDRTFYEYRGMVPRTGAEAQGTHDKQHSTVLMDEHGNIWDRGFLENFGPIAKKVETL